MPDRVYVPCQAFRPNLEPCGKPAKLPNTYCDEHQARLPYWPK